MSTFSAPNSPHPPALDIKASASPSARATPGGVAQVDWGSVAIRINARTLLIALLLVMLVVLSLHLWVVVTFLQGLDFKGSQRLYFDDEGNVPAYFSTFILFLAAVLLTCIAYFKRAEKDCFAGHWTVLSFMFFGLTADEALSFHEMLIDPMRSAFGFSGWMRFSWILMGGAFTAAVALAYLPFLHKLAPVARRQFIIAGSVYVAGVLGLEMISGPFFEDYEAGRSVAPYLALMTMEETLEMTGILLFIRALLNYLQTYRPVFSVQLD
jgi:hypothetical protein